MRKLPKLSLMTGNGCDVLVFDICRSRFAALLFHMLTCRQSYRLLSHSTRTHALQQTADIRVYKLQSNPHASSQVKSDESDSSSATRGPVEQSRKTPAKYSCWAIALQRKVKSGGLFTVQFLFPSLLYLSLRFPFAFVFAFYCWLVINVDDDFKVCSRDGRIFFVAFASIGSIAPVPALCWALGRW